MATFSGNYRIALNRINAKINKDTMKMIGETARNFVLENFDKEAWQGQTQVPWAKRKNPNNNKKLLIATGKGKNSVRYQVEKNKVIVMAGGTPHSYMRVHNFGSNEVVTQKVNPFTRKIKKGKRAGTEQQVQAFTRRVKLNIPKRQFIGVSPVLIRRLNEVIKSQINEVTSNL